jgi:hypothetical protein
MVGTGFIKPTTRLMADVDGFWQSLTKLSNFQMFFAVQSSEYVNKQWGYRLGVH